MAKMVDCKSCKKEVAQYARACPHCGQKNPTVNVGVGCLIIIGIAVLIGFLFTGGESNDGQIENHQSNTSHDIKVLKESTEKIANNVAMKAGVNVKTDCINLAANDQVITFKCISENTSQSVTFKQKFERDDSSPIGWKPVWNDRVEKALSSLNGYAPY